ncbi:hypothetical protein QVD17_02411 [Tagetes erecta]|uniref:Uncharacterized protein n=1 Tax=Tagetes erecta TaxID=13708 RepID=A0AAD8L9C0_TARER|nr:hypothetical protein QVD17_02411 [Tagetes erecta]
MSAVCGSYLQTSAEEEVDQTSAVCKKKSVYNHNPVIIFVHIINFNSLISLITTDLHQLLMYPEHSKRINPIKSNCFI